MMWRSKWRPLVTLEQGMNSAASAPGVGFQQDSTRLQAAAVRRAKADPMVLAPGESDAHPPEAPAHWSLRARAFVIVGLALLSWVAVGGLVLLLWRR